MPEAAAATLARVLVVEDDDVNRFVIAEKVKALGYEVLEAKNGWEAVQVVSSEPLQVVLMDCQMPVMDGCTAAREIRKLEGPSASVPIVALTANAHDGEREKVLAAGMNAFLTKPVRDAQLASTLSAQLELAKQEESGRPEGACESERVQDGPVPELDADIVRSVPVISLCLRAWPEQLHALGQSERTGDYEAMRAHAHKLKGGASCVGATALTRALETLMQVSYSLHAESPEQERAAVSDVLSRVLHAGERACALLREEGARQKA